jgi:hypothetical protein
MKNGRQLCVVNVSRRWLPAKEAIARAFSLSASRGCEFRLMQTQVLINCDNSGGKFNSMVVLGMRASFAYIRARPAPCEMYPIMSERAREKDSQLEKQSAADGWQIKTTALL